MSKQRTLFSYPRKAHNPHTIIEDDEDDIVPKIKSNGSKKITMSKARSSKKRKRDEDYEIDKNEEEENYDQDEHVEEEEFSTPQRKRAKTTTFKKKKDETRYDWLIDKRDENGIKEGEPDYDPHTLYIPQSAYTNMTPFEKQYWDIKKKNWDTVIFFKKGKFYELYEKDADIGKMELDLKMTERVNMRMVGVPESSFNHWASKFIALGYKIGRVEQMETPNDVKNRKKKTKAVKGSTDNVVARELQQILTAGTLVDPEMIADSTINNYLLCVKEDTVGHRFGICFVDTSTSEVNLGLIDDDSSSTAFETLLHQIIPKEILFERGGLSKQTSFVLRNSKVATMTPRKPLSEFWDRETTERNLEGQQYFDDWPDTLHTWRNNDLVMSAFGAMVSYLRELKLDEEILSLNNFRTYDPNSDTATMLLDGQTLINLEILQNNRDGEKRGSLLEFLDFCVLPFGRRLFRNWVCHPLRCVDAIIARQDAIEQFENAPDLVEEIKSRMKTIPDLERLLSRIHAEACTKKDHISFDPNINKKRIKLLLDTLKGIEDANNIISMLGVAVEEQTLKSDLIVQIINDTPDVTQVLERFQTMFDHEMARKTGFIISQSGENEQYDQAMAALNEVDERLKKYLQKAAKELKLSVDKINYKSLQKQPYQIEVPSATKVPDSWVMISQTSKVKRYYPRDLLPLIEDRTRAEETRETILRGEMRRIFALFDEYYVNWKKVVQKIAELDCLISLSTVSRHGGLEMCRPEFITSDICLDVEEMVHPCVIPPEGSFVPNDTKMGTCRVKNKVGEYVLKPSFIIVTGANMGGKSTILRQNCIAVILAQLGCKVPAQYCRLSPVDRIFTRIGANDRIMSGESTFMVELNETSNILRHATKNSLIILDELGRGTSTFDGYAIAYAVARYLAENVKCRTLFSTHYFHLTEELHANPYIALYQMAVNEDSKKFDVTFLYRFVEGVAPKSYGLSVAKKAGIPMQVIENAMRVAKNFEDVLRIGGGNTCPGGKNVFTEEQRKAFEMMYRSLCEAKKGTDWDAIKDKIMNSYRVYNFVSL